MNPPRGYLVLVHSPEGPFNPVAAPESFDWLNYPRTLELEGRHWRYIGTLEGRPYYHLEGTET